MSTRNAAGALYLLASAALGGLRVAGEKGQVFQAAAHLWVGLLFGLYFSGRRRLYLWLAVGLTVLEVVCFAVGLARG